ncbi:hypothetical protein DENIS_4578 [Desulfonema ishimotonii]|uniref:Uncharacterized protein n=1 Tax=Desulfonema ishimotonii TaxID=45657 RepID=A0A401G2X1_9BACT|nr:hypothetical protein [Desulfonema ishimotonii]GBC63580.1 hypothetical protein DENIS_4578 [Desulfonema ishimotonii]
MTNLITVSVRCPNCRQSLMNPGKRIDDLPSIAFQAKVADKIGQIYLSQIYGSYHKLFEGVEDIADAVIECSCPHCHTPFPVSRVCDCKAPVISINLQIGGTINVCTRNGCKHHSAEFENLDDAFMLFQNQDETRYS